MLSDGTALFTSAMEEVAAASQEQSASTEEIAAAGHELLRAAARLTQLTAGFRTESDASPAGAEPAAASVAAPALTLVRESRPAQSAA